MLFCLSAIILIELLKVESGTWFKPEIHFVMIRS